jgi:Flp pilus assembly protein CpaB
MKSKRFFILAVVAALGIGCAISLVPSFRHRSEWKETVGALQSLDRARVDSALEAFARDQKPRGTVPFATGALDDARVLAIARAAVATKDTWVDRAEFDRPKRHPDGSWSVFVWRLPTTWGGHRFISIDPKGSVTAYERGL